ncbi:MAG: hypothetical protein QW275_00495 [Candidatus Anstonellaceae archaeon]
MYHPGKVVAVLSPKDSISSDKSVQATLKMWDDNVITMLVDSKIAPSIREGDMVLCDYRPEKGLSVPVPRHVVIKILKGKSAEKMWHEYKEVHDKRKRNENRESQQSYIG